MIFSQISLLDCLVFLLFLTPQLILQVGFFTTAAWIIQHTPYLIIQLPYQFIVERFFVPFEERSPFVQRATVFQDFVIRCVRYAFAFLPASIGRVFFSKSVALPFLRFRMLRHGYFKSSISWEDINQPNMKGVWIRSNPHCDPDVVVYYCHGGGFSMGSTYFYMEFLLALVTLLQEAGYKSPALFSLEYTLVPDAVYPTQIQQALAGYEHVLSIVGDSSRLCVAGDSAGATIVLGMLLAIAEHEELSNHIPSLACMISPWVTIVSEKNRNTRSDYLDAQSLHRYGMQYINKVGLDDPIASPGNCRTPERWLKASPDKGWFFLFSDDEVLAPEARTLTELLVKAGAKVEVREITGSVHAWPVAAIYLGQNTTSRLEGVRSITSAIKQKIPIGKC